MKLLDTLLIFSAAGWLIISMDSIMRGNFQNNYWMLMMSLGSFFYFIYRKNKRKENDQDEK
tara:strand:+ start:610 stop:792 length:183 start_codon:yes stop_codon:yes gene_type:complete